MSPLEGDAFFTSQMKFSPGRLSAFRKIPTRSLGKASASFRSSGSDFCFFASATRCRAASARISRIMVLAFLTGC